MNRLAFQILGDPVPKGRPRFRKRGRFTQTYTPDTTREFEALVSDHAALHAIQQRWPRAYSGLCEVRLIVVCARPQNRYRKVDPDGRMWRETGRGDADNHAKSVIDGMQTAGVFRNDNQVVRLVVDLQWNAKDEAPCVEVECLTLTGSTSERLVDPPGPTADVGSNPSGKIPTVETRGALGEGQESSTVGIPYRASGRGRFR